jgi:hypothetical protein
LRSRVALTGLAAVALAAGCGGGHRATTKATGNAQPCPLTAAQRRDIAAAKREIVRMHKLEAPLKKVRATGPRALELAVNRFLLDVGPLPVNVKGRLMDKGKSAVGLCRDCFDAIEALEPAVQTRIGGSPCAAR